MDTSKQTYDIVLLTCNRKDFTRQTIEGLHERLTTPFRLIVVDDESVDGTREYLEKLKEEGKVSVLIANKTHKNICQGYNDGFKHVKSEYFFTMQDDIIIPKLEPDVIQQLVALIKKYPEYGGIGCRIQRIPNINWNQPEEIIPARKALSAYFRVQRKDTMEKHGFGNRDWDDRAFVQIVRERLGMGVGWAKNLWCNHIGYCQDRGYHVKPRKWGTGIHSRTQQDWIKKPYPELDPLTNVPIRSRR